MKPTLRAVINNKKLKESKMTTVYGSGDDTYAIRHSTYIRIVNSYSDLPNNRAANLIIFWGKNTYTTLLGPTRLLISENFPSKPDFHLHK